MLIILSAILITVNFLFLKKKITELNANSTKTLTFRSLPVHYSYCFLLWITILLILIFSISHNSEILQKILLLFTALLFFSLFTIFLFKKGFNAKNHLEGFIKIIMLIATLCGVIITVLITISILFEAIRFFRIVGFFDFIFGTKWNPQVSVSSGQEVGESSFGMIPIFLGTLLITFIAMIFAVPLGLFGAIYLSQYAKSKVRDILKPLLEILAGIPTVVYGYFAAVVIAPFLKNFFAGFGVNIASESALGAGLVMGIMIIPFILSLSEDAISAVPTSLKDGALALGSTKSEMIRKVVLVSAYPGIISAILLAISRAVGETMIVVMAAGLVAKMTINPLESVTTATVQIVTLLVGDQESDSVKTLAAFGLGLVLFVMTLIFNIIALITVKKFKSKQ